jgi:hypothetical protein
MHPREVRAEALALVKAGLNDCEISRRLGIPRRTILDWRKPPSKRYVRTIVTETCPRCWLPARPMQFSAPDYAELLGLYLGDGYISAHPRTSRLRIALDAKYVRIIEETEELVRRCFPHNPVGRVQAHGGTMYFVSVYSTHLPCLFPQHGPGPKHRRALEFEDWQLEVVDAAPFAFLRGCIRSDGCVFVNRTDVHRPKPYEYLSYAFSNMSGDIVDLFVATCEQVGVFTRVNQTARGLWTVRINRRASVALLLEHVGRKA